jgi:hypothetical protein
MTPDVACSYGHRPSCLQPLNHLEDSEPFANTSTLFEHASWVLTAFDSRILAHIIVRFDAPVPINSFLIPPLSKCLTAQTMHQATTTNIPLTTRLFRDHLDAFILRSPSAVSWATCPLRRE